MTDVREILRRLQLGEPDRRIARDLSISRNTVARYRLWADQHGVLAGGPLPDLATLAGLLTPAPSERPVHEQSLVEPLRERVRELYARGVEGQAIWQLLIEQHGFTGSYSSVKRFLRRFAPARDRATIRLEVEPGDEAQVDFGYAGQFLDPESGRVRRAWVFVMTLSFSRHQYAELVFDQSIETWGRLHRAAFEFFGGVPRRVVLDNLRAAIVHAALYDPEVQRSYRECAEHYGFLIAPCRPRTPEHKGKVEQGGVHYVKRNALAGRAFRDLPEGNRHLLRWCLEIAGRRVHGTTRQIPLAVFDDVERGALRPLPLSPWQLTEWKRAKLHGDCHVVFDGAYDSAPHRLIGQRLWVRAAGRTVELFHDYTLIATHRRARPGQRRTLTAHLPPEKVHFLMQTPVWCRQRAAEIGPAGALFIDALLGDRPLDRLRSAQGVLRFLDRYGAARVDAACARAHAVGEYRDHTIKDHPRSRPRSAAAAGPRADRVRARADAATSRSFVDHLLPRPRTGRQEVTHMELTHQLAPMLRTLRLSGILETLDLRNRQAVEQQSSFVEFLTLLLPDEVERRAQSKLRRRLRRAAFDPTKTLEGFNFSFNAKLNKAQIFDLATCQYLARHECVLVDGPTGVGKSHLAQALAHEACRRGYEVLFVATDKMLAYLAGGRADGTRESRLARYTRPDLLVLDDFGLKPFRAPGPEDLYDVINERYERGSILVTSNRDRAEWPELFGEPLLASAALDRLTHGAHFVEITGQSFRAEHTKKPLTARRSRGASAA